MRSDEFVQRSLHLTWKDKKVRFKLIASKYRDPFQSEFYFRECYNSKVCNSSGFRFSTTLTPDAIYHNYYPKHEEFEIDLIEE